MTQRNSRHRSRPAIYEHVGFVANISAIFSNIQNILNVVLSIFAPGLAFWGVASNSLGSSVLPSFELASYGLAARLITFVLIATGLGAGLSLVMSHLLKKRTEIAKFSVNGVGILWAGLLIGTSDWLADSTNTRYLLPEFALFCTLGMIIVFRVLSFQFGPVANRARSANATQLPQKSTAILCFSGTAIFMYLIILLGSAP